MGRLERIHERALSEIDCDICKYIDNCKEMYTKKELAEMDEEEVDKLYDGCRWRDEEDRAYDNAVDEEIDRMLGK